MVIISTIFLPTAAFLLILMALDSFALVRRQRLALCLASGLLSCVIAYVFSLAEVLPDALFPLLEEILKSAFIIWMISKKRMVFLAEAMCYGGAAGAGFALLENSLYAIYYPEMSFWSATIRGVGTALLHIGCTSVFASIFLVLLNRRAGTCGKNEAPALARAYAAAIVPPLAIHHVYNMFLMPASVQMLVTVTLFFVVFIAISAYNERRIYSWLDDSITYDIQLLSAIREGRLADTPAGKYLTSVKSQFDPRVFFDVICFMQLYLELVVMGKSRMLLEQEGLAQPLSQEETEKYNAMRTELGAMRRNIGFMGEYVLRPILRYAPEDLRFTRS